MIFYHMIDIETEIEESWKQPEEGFNEDIQLDSEMEMVRFGINGVDRLIGSIGNEHVWPLLR